MIGTTVGKYRISERLGRGGMGIVYKAVDETLDREVAIKVLSPDVDDAELLKRFRGEAISLARLNHPGIATIYELYRHGDDLLMVMEYVRGETLQTLSERLGPLEPPQAAHICVQILDGLGHAHRAGIVHRDLKPANVMVTDSGVVKIMDFGIARMLGGEHFTHAGYMMGTPAYMAPEQVLGHEIDGRADLYSVGVLFYRLLTRELPFQADTAIAMAQKQVAEAPTPLRTFRPNLPPWCEAIITRALSKAPAERFQSAEAFRAAIRSAVTPAALGELPTMATPSPANLLKTSDLTLPLPGELTSTASTTTRTVADLDATVAAGPSGTAGSAATTPGSGTISPTERTGTTVVLGRGHLMALSAMLIVLIGGIAALGFVALRRGGGILQTAATLPAAPSTPPSTAPEQPNQPAPPVQPDPAAPQQPAPGEGVKADAATPPSAPAGTPPAGTSAASGTAGREEKPTTKPKPASKPSERASVPAEAPAPPSDPLPAEPPPPPPPAPEVAPITFKDVKVVLAAGQGLRDRDAVLRLDGDQLAVLDRPQKTEILTLSYASIVQAFYSRSKQPKWKGPDGKDQEASVDLGALGFFRGDRNWLILTTQTGRVILRVENDDLQSVLSAVRERTGLAVQRSTADR